MKSSVRRRHHLDEAAQDYAQTLIEMQDLCDRLDLNFRREMMLLAEQWIERHTQPRHDTPDHDHQARQTR